MALEREKLRYHCKPQNSEERAGAHLFFFQALSDSPQTCSRYFAESLKGGVLTKRVQWSGQGWKLQIHRKIFVKLDNVPNYPERSAKTMVF